MALLRVHCHKLPAIDWSDATGYPDSPAHTVTVYRLRIADTESLQPDLQRIISADERDRANRFFRIEDWQRFVAVRGLLRYLLATRTGIHPAQLRFGTIANQKPVLVDSTEWHVNVSHSGDYALLAIARQPVGVDLERINPAFDWRDILTQSFSPAEQQFIGTGPDATNHFYRLWTRKEALLKATGQGLTDDLPGVPTLDGVHQIRENMVETDQDWTVSSFAVATGYIGALARPTDLTSEQAVFCQLDAAGLRTLVQGHR